MKNNPSWQQLDEALRMGQKLDLAQRKLTEEEANSRSPFKPAPLEECGSKQGLEQQDLPTVESARKLGQVGPEAILRCLPHRPPMLMLDRVLTIQVGEHATGIKKLTGNEYGIKSGRFGFVFPSSFALEALGQLATVCLFHSDDPEKEQQTANVALTGIKNLKVHSEVLDPCTLTLSVHILQFRRKIARVQGHCLAGDRPFVDAQFDLFVQ